MNKKPILCLDFDGVIHSYKSGWQGATVIPDPPVEGAIEFLLEAMDHFEVAIHSSRSSKWGGRRAMKRWLRKYLDEWRGVKNLGWLDLPHYEQDYGAPPDHDENEWAGTIIRKMSWPLFKPAAFITIDDRAFIFEGTWPDCKWLKQFKPWTVGKRND